MSKEWIRATASVLSECSFCLETTNRLTAFRKADSPHGAGYTTAFVCDDCHKGICSAREKKPGVG